MPRGKLDAEVVPKKFSLNDPSTWPAPPEHVDVTHVRLKPEFAKHIDVRMVANNPEVIERRIAQGYIPIPKYMIDSGFTAQGENQVLQERVDREPEYAAHFAALRDGKVDEYWHIVGGKSGNIAFGIRKDVKAKRDEEKRRKVDAQIFGIKARLEGNIREILGSKTSSYDKDGKSIVEAIIPRRGDYKTVGDTIAERIAKRHRNKPITKTYHIFK